MAGAPKYEMRYCAYIDILGFSELVGELRSIPGRFEQSVHSLQRFDIPMMRLSLASATPISEHRVFRML